VWGLALPTFNINLLKTISCTICAILFLFVQTQYVKNAVYGRMPVY